MIQHNPTQEVTIVGDDFTPGAQGDSEIDAMLGHSTCLLEDQAIRSEKFGCIIAPNYSDEIEITKAELDKLNLDPLILTVRPVCQKKTKNNDLDPPLLFTASFIYDDEQHLTRPFETEAQALSCVLWYVLVYY